MHTTHKIHVMRCQYIASDCVFSERRTPLVGGAVELLDHLLVDLGLLGGVHADEGGRDDLVDVVDGAQDALAHVGSATVAELESLGYEMANEADTNKAGGRAGFVRDLRSKIVTLE